MKKSLIIVIVVAGLAATSLVSRAEDANQLFADAGKAYDAGQFAEARQKYESILEQGQTSHELFFNLGNALYKQGRTADAVLQYRRAWMLAPRDPDAAANLRLAAQASKALVPDLPLASVLFFKLSFKEWMRVALVSYWICAVLIAIHFFARSRRPLLRRMMAISSFALALGIAGAAQWYAMHRRPEVVVLAAGQQALYAPMENSTPHFALPPGSVVRTIESSGPWVKVAYGKDAGWIKHSACAAVYPWHPQG